MVQEVGQRDRGWSELGVEVHLHHLLVVQSVGHDMSLGSFLSVMFLHDLGAECSPQDVQMLSNVDEAVIMSRGH